MWGPESHCHHQGVPNPTPLSPRSPHTPQPPICAPRSTPCAMGAAGDVGPSITLSPSGCPHPHCPQGAPLSPWCPIVPMVSHCPPMGVPKASHCPQDDPPPQPPICAPWIALCAMGAAGGDVGPSVTLSPSGCPQPHSVVPMVSHCPHDVPPPPAPNLHPTDRPVCNGCHWWRCGAQHHIVTLGLSPTRVPLSPRCPIVPLCLSPRRPIIPTMSPPVPPQPPTCAPWSAPCAMGAAGGGDVGPSVTLSPSGCPHPHVPKASHCPQAVPSPCPIVTLVSHCHHAVHPPPSPQPVPHRSPCAQWVLLVEMWGPASHCHPWAVPNPTPLSPRRPIVPKLSPTRVPLSPGCHIVTPPPPPAPSPQPVPHGAPHV